MIREDIIGMLNSAVSRGYPLRSAMQSLLNAGYSKEEIEAAARSLTHPEPIITKTLVQEKPFLKSAKKNNNNISDYKEPIVKTSNIFIYILVGVLVFLIIGLVLTIIYKDPIIEFLKKFL